MTENELVRKIVYSANKEASVLINLATADAEQKLAQAQQDANERKKRALAVAEQKMRRKSEEMVLANEVEGIKQKINAKAEIMKTVFDGISAKIMKSGTTEKQKLISNLTKKYGRAGDKITPTTDGGIIISNKNYDIDLSLSVLIDDLKNEIEPDIAKMLF
jgi:vacuolar-type H+-ATPase subunit E/Vma4